MDIQLRNFNTQANIAAYIENRFENTDVYYGGVITSRFILHVYSEEDEYESIKEDIENLKLQKSDGNPLSLSCTRVPYTAKELFVCSIEV